MKNYYFKDVLLGLRSSYLEHQKQLDKLKQCVRLNDEMVRDYYFWVSQGELLFDRDIIMSRLNEFIEKYKGTIDFTTTSKCIIEDKNYIIERSFYNNPIIINQSEFNKRVKLLLDSKFVKGNEKNNIVNNSDLKFLTTTRQISIDLLNEKHSLYYYSNLDSLHISSLLVNKECLDRLLFQKISIDLLNPYQIETIENSCVNKYEICIPEFESSQKSCEFMIEEEGSKIYIIKR